MDVGHRNIVDGSLIARPAKILSSGMAAKKLGRGNTRMR
jgi:hypothetical protein